ncbi:MAG: hypothetical protein AAF288_04345 [Planctomycetota bacterium]
MALFTRKPSETPNKPRRLAIVVGVGVAIVGSVTAVTAIGVMRNARGPAQARATALQAYDRGDHDAVVRELSPLLSRFEEDSAVLTAYGMASLKRADGPDDPMQAVDALRRSFSLDPSQTEVAETLMEVFARAASPQVRGSAIAYARHVVDAEPDNLDAKRLLVALLEEAGRTNEAVELAKNLARSDPRIGHLLLVGRLADDTAERAEWFATLTEESPERAEPRIAWAMALSDVGRIDEALRELETAAEHPDPAVEDAASIDALWMQLGQPERALDYLERTAAAARSNSEEVQIDAQSVSAAAPARSRADGLAGLLGLRAYELRRYDSAVQAWASIAPEHRRVHEQALLTRLQAAEHDADNTQTLDWPEGFAEREAPRAQAWRTALLAEQDANTSGLSTADAWLAAAAEHGYDPHLLAIAAERMLEREDWDRAITLSRQAAGLRPSWGGPRLTWALAELQRGQPELAATLAEQAYRLGDPRAAAVLLQSRVAALPGMPPAQQLTVLEELDRQQQAHPGQSWLVRLRLSALVEAGDRRQAQEVALAWLASLDPTNGAAVAEWAITTTRLGLNLEDRAAQALSSLSPEQAALPEVLAARAELAARTGDAEKALALGNRLAELAETSPEAAPEAKAAWLEQRAQMLEQVSASAADQAWLEAADRQPQRLEPQRRALLRDGLRNQADVSDRLLGRIDRLAGEDSPTARADRARVWLTGPDASTRAQAALDLLPEPGEDNASIDTDLLRVRALGLLGRLDRAITRAEAVIEALPATDARGPRIELLLASMEHQLDRTGSALRRTADVMRNPRVNADTRAQAAAQSITLGGPPAEAAQVLLALSRSGRLSAAHDMTLAEAVVAGGLHREAHERLQRMLQAPTPEAIRLAVAHYGRRGQHDRVDQTLALLEQTDASPSQAAAVRAQALRWRGDLQGSAEAIQQAVQAEPTEARWRYMLAEAWLLQNDIENARAVSAEGRVVFGSDPVWDAVDTACELAASYGPIDGSVLSAAVRRPASVALLRLAVELGQDETASALAWVRLAGDLVASDADPALGVFVIDTLLERAAEEPDPEAGRALARAAQGLIDGLAQRYPARAETSRRQAEAAALAGDWAVAAEAAGRWSRSDLTSQDAARLEAEALRRTGRADAALLRLDRAFSREELTRSDALRRVWVLSLAANGRLADAQAVLRPRLTVSPVHRAQAVELLAHGGWTAGPSRAWLEAVQTSTPQDPPDERLTLARAWGALASRHNEPEVHEAARAFVEELAEQADPPIEVIGLAAELARLRGDAVGSERWLGNLLQAAPDNAAARNNLSAALRSLGGADRLEESVRQAEKAVELAPEQAAYWDTLGQARQAQGDLAGATRAFERAVELAPGESEYRARLRQAKLEQDG